MYHIKDLEQHLRLVRVRNFDYIATSIISQYVTNAHLLPRLQGRVSQCGRRDNHWSLRNTFCKLNLENVGFDRNGWWRTGPQPEGGNCPRRNFHKRMYLLATATSYIILPPPPKISVGCGPGDVQAHELQTSYALFRHCVLAIIATGTSSRCAQYAS